jgi:hypothetical protein
MSTHCGIAIKTEKGYEVIYCHHDGYPEYMWPMLTENYNSGEKADALISFGDASYIDKLLEPTSDFHKFGTPEPNVCMFYHRDRGEDWVSTHSQTFEKSRLFNSFYYAYVWEDGAWHFYEGGKEKEIYR